MNIKSYKHLIIIFAGILVTGLGYLWFYGSPYFEQLSVWAQSHLIALSVALVFIKIIGIIWPPIPGGIFTLGAIPVLGWSHAYLLDLLGSVIGSSIAFWIAQRWGINFLQKIFDQKTIEKIQTIRVHKHREIEAVFVFRLFGSNIVELVCYAAGLLKVSYKNYIIATLLAHMAGGLPFYYFAGELFQGRNIFINIIFVLTAVVLFMIFKKRYFVSEEAEVSKPLV